MTSHTSHGYSSRHECTSVEWAFSLITELLVNPKKVPLFYHWAISPCRLLLWSPGFTAGEGHWLFFFLSSLHSTFLCYESYSSKRRPSGWFSLNSSKSYIQLKCVVSSELHFAFKFWEALKSIINKLIWAILGLPWPRTRREAISPLVSIQPCFHAMHRHTYLNKSPLETQDRFTEGRGIRVV